jgi:hypothetical protein
MKKLMKKLLSLLAILILSATLASAQTTEVTIQLNEQFFDSLLDAIFRHSGAPEFPLAGVREEEMRRKGDAETRGRGDGEKNIFVNAAFDDKRPATGNRQLTADNRQLTTALCPETIRIQREIDGVRTAVRLRDGKVFAPIAFTGSYNPPLIGCVEFSGVADATIDLQFDRERQALVGFVRVSSVNLSGTGGIGSSMIAGMVQSSIDRKINPLQILPLEKISFVVPIQNTNGLRMKALNIKNEIGNGVLNVRITYEFQKV